MQFNLGSLSGKVLLQRHLNHLWTPRRFEHAGVFTKFVRGDESWPFCCWTNAYEPKLTELAQHKNHVPSKITDLILSDYNSVWGSRTVQYHLMGKKMIYCIYLVHFRHEHAVVWQPSISL